jgi:hypothetical protein
MTLKPSLITTSLALALACGEAPGADLGSLDLSSGSSGFSTTPAAGSFVDTLSFTLSVPAIANGSVTTAVNGNQDLDFASVALSGPSGDFAFSMLLGDPVEVWALPGSGAVLGAGLYTLIFAGTNSAGIASYGGNFAVMPISPVPEPASFALMLAGASVVLFLARRRRD